jgi:hypothetical protein
VVCEEMVYTGKHLVDCKMCLFSILTDTHWEEQKISNNIHILTHLSKSLCALGTLSLSFMYMISWFIMFSLKPMLRERKGTNHGMTCDFWFWVIRYS